MADAMDGCHKAVIHAHDWCHSNDLLNVHAILYGCHKAAIYHMIYVIALTS